MFQLFFSFIILLIQIYLFFSAVSIHTSRGFGGYRPSAICSRGSQFAPLRFLGPSLRAATPLTALWAAACSLHTVLLLHALATLWGHYRVEQKQTHTEVLLTPDILFQIFICPWILKNLLVSLFFFTLCLE